MIFACTEKGRQKMSYPLGNELKKVTNLVGIWVLAGFVLSAGLAIASQLAGSEGSGFFGDLGGNLVFYPFFFLISFISSRILYVLGYYRDAVAVNVIIPVLFAASALIG